MMRAPGVWGLAVRTPDGAIATQSAVVRTSAHHVLRLPFVRGVVALGETLAVGVHTTKLAMFYASGQAERRNEKSSRVQLLGAVMLALVMVIVLFKIVPLLIASTLGLHGLAFVGVEGAIRVGVFVAYLAGISVVPHLQRVYQYHAAEHKAVHAYERGLELTPENVQAQSRIHPRCGTAFLLWVLIVAVAVYAVVGQPALWILIISRVVLLPVIAAITYELMKLATAHRNRVVGFIMAPGLALQCNNPALPD